MGLIFQMPLISYFLSRFKLINSKILRKNYKFSIILIIIAAIITPTGDIINKLAFIFYANDFIIRIKHMGR